MPNPLSSIDVRYEIVLFTSNTRSVETSLTDAVCVDDCCHLRKDHMCNLSCCLVKGLTGTHNIFMSHAG